MHAIYRQNFGFTDIIIGRKHADAPYHDGSPIWGDFDAQEIFNKLRGDLRIKPLKVGFAAYYESVGRVDLMENHAGEKPVFISGKQVRAHAPGWQDRRSANHALAHGEDSDRGDGRPVGPTPCPTNSPRSRLALAAVLIGLSKTGVPGVSIPRSC